MNYDEWYFDELTRMKKKDKIKSILLMIMAIICFAAIIIETIRLCLQIGG